LQIEGRTKKKSVWAPGRGKRGRESTEKVTLNNQQKGKKGEQEYINRRKEGGGKTSFPKDFLGAEERWEATTEGQRKKTSKKKPAEKGR